MLRAVLLASVMLLAVAATASAAPSWLPSVPVSGPLVLDARDIDIAGDGGGGAAVVWSRRGTVQTAMRERGGAWSAVQNLYSGGLWPTGARVAMNPRGEALAVWTENPTTGTIVRGSLRLPGGKFGPAFDVSRPSTTDAAVAPVVAMAPSGAAVVVWRRGAMIQAVVRDTAGGQFGLPDDLSAAGAVTGNEPRVMMGPAGEVTAVWREADATVVVATRAPRGEWSIARPAGWVGTEPNVVADPAGAPTIAWNAQTNLTYVRRAGGGWTAPTLFGTDQWSTEIAVDTDGAVAAINGSGVGVRTPSGLVQRTGLGNSVSYNIDYRASFAAGFRGGLLAFYNAGGQGWGAAVRTTGGAFGATMFPSAVTWVIARSTVIGDDDGNATAVWEQFESAGWRIVSSDYDASPPTLSDVVIPERVTVGEAAVMSASATDGLSGATLTWDFGDGTSASGAVVGHPYSEAGDWTVKVTARDGVGNAVSRSATVQVLPLPVPTVAPTPPPPVVIDVDGDGFPPPQDCDDTRASVRPGTPEVLGNALDENCDGVREPYPTVGAAAALTTQRLPDRSTQLLTLRIRDLDAGDTVSVRCAGKGCRKAMKHAQTARKPVKTLDLTKLVKRTKLRSGAKVEVRVSHPGRVTRIFTFVMRSGGDGSPRRVRECQAPEGGARRAC